MTEASTRFPLVLRLPIQWGDLDALGHVNNTIYFRHFESARMTYFERTGVMEGFTRTRVGPILASTSCQFKTPIRYPDSVEVHAGVAEMRTTSFTMLYRIFCDGGRRLAAEGNAIVVMYDYPRGEKAPIPPEVRAAFEAFERGAAATARQEG